MNLTRRHFLQSSGRLVAYSGLVPLLALNPVTARAAANPGQVRPGKTLVVIFLRGGIDGLNLIVPHADEHYPQLRKQLAIPRPGQGGADAAAIDLDGFFGLHPAARAIQPLFEEGQAVALHAVGYPDNTRSHFEEQDTWETGISGNTLGSDGWLNRHLLTSTSDAQIRAVAIGTSLPRILRGEAAAYAVRGLDQLALPGEGERSGRLAAALEHAYSCDPRTERDAARDLLARTAAATLAGCRQLEAVRAQEYTPAAEYPQSGLAGQLREAARLIKASIGVEVLELEYGGWDTHSDQGGINGGYANKLRELSEAIAAFRADLGAKMDDVLVLTLSDFGRTAAENGTRGTDHGWGNAMLAFGGGVGAAAEGRKVHGTWPGLAPEQLKDRRDLAHTTDFRDVLAEAVGKHLGNTHLAEIIPDHEHQPVGLL